MFRNAFWQSRPDTSNSASGAQSVWSSAHATEARIPSPAAFSALSVYAKVCSGVKVLLRSNIELIALIASSVVKLEKSPGSWIAWQSAESALVPPVESVDVGYAQGNLLSIGKASVSVTLCAAISGAALVGVGKASIFVILCDATSGAALVGASVQSEMLLHSAPRFPAYVHTWQNSDFVSTRAETVGFIVVFGTAV